MKHGAHELRLLSQLLDAHAELPASGRDAWLEALTGEAARLRPALARMLARQSGGELDDFLERPPEIAAPVGAAAGSDFNPGDGIGPYRLLRPVGRGGMGEVWLATRADGQLKRNVALKLPMLSVRRSVLVQRFERERDILGGLIHPNIARLYDAGVADDGQPYMALEYVEGTPITEAAANGTLDAAARVRLLRQVMDAVQYAHANLVIHRDLKPGNVLVTAEGQAKLLDFGIAKLVEDEAGVSPDSELTRLSGRALTLRYAAPELVKGSVISTAVDVWALGVLLYELLTGQRPFDGSGSIEQAILHAEPRPPSQALAGVKTGLQANAIARLSRSRSGDLDTITLKALKKDPAERYATVGAFADDLDRWMRGEAVSAQRDSRWYRARRFVGRNTLAFSVATLAGVAVIGIAVVAVVLGLRAREESARAVAARNFMTDIFLNSDRDLSAGKEMSARQLLSLGYRKVVETMREQPLLQAELLVGIGDALDFFEDLPQADQALQQAALAYQRAGRPGDAARTTMARATLRYYNAWEVAGAAELMARAVKMHPAPDTDDEFMAKNAIYRASAAVIDGSSAEARNWYERAGPIADRAFPYNTTGTVMAIRTMALLDAENGAYETASNRLNGLLARLRTESRTRPAWIVGVLDDLARVEFLAGRYRAALEKFDAADAYCQTSSDPRGLQCIYNQYGRARLLLLLGYSERALETVPALLDRSRISENSAAVASLFTAQAIHVLVVSGQLDQYPALSAQVRALGESISAEDWQDRMPFLLVQVRMFLDQGRLDEAQAMSHRTQTLPDGRALEARTSPEAFVLGGLVAHARGQHDRALALLEAAQAAQAAMSSADDPRTLLVSLHRARTLWSLQRREDALAVIDRALPTLSQAMGQDAPVIARIHALRAELAIKNAETSKASRMVELFI